MQIQEIRLDSVPEPTTVGLLGIFGLGALGLAARRRFRCA